MNTYNFDLSKQFLKENSIDRRRNSLLEDRYLKRDLEWKKNGFWFVNTGHVAEWITQLEDRGGGRRQSSDKFSRTLEPNRARQD